MKSARMYPSVQPPQFKNGSQTISEELIHTNANFQLAIEKIGSSTTIYYTLDGNDPRMWDLTGNVSPTAKQITTQNEIISIKDSTVIKARSKNGNEWSPLHELTIIPDSNTSVTYDETNDKYVRDFQLYQNYPNPFNPVTKIYFKLPVTCYVSLRIYDMLGREVEVLVDEIRSSGSYQQLFDGSRLTSGIYFARLKTASVNRKIKLVLCR